MNIQLITIIILILIHLVIYLVHKNQLIQKYRMLPDYRRDDFKIFLLIGQSFCAFCYFYRFPSVRLFYKYVFGMLMIVFVQIFALPKALK